MTQSADPLENAMAERVNGILKQEFLQGSYLVFKDAKRAVITVISIYNNERLHGSIDMLTPNQAHLMSGELKRHWKTYYSKQENLEANMSE
jgi:transposase InsO family protein